MFFALATNGGDQGLYKIAPTRAKADELLDQRMAAPFAADANDILTELTAGHGTSAQAKFWKKELEALLKAK